MNKIILPKQKAITIFLVFALSYYISNLLRAITATISPNLISEFDLSAGDLGLLGGGYFLGFAAVQIPLGYLLDNKGPKKIVSYFLLIAVLGMISFSLSENFITLLISRILIGIGVGACLMGPLTAYRIWYQDETQQRANSWMLMVGAIGMLSSSLPVQFFLPIICYCRIDTYTTDADIIISDTGITDTDNKLNAIRAESSVYSTLFQIFILGISMCMIMIVSLNSTSFKKHNPSTKMQAVKKWFVLFLLLSGDVSGRILNTASTTNGSNINETKGNNDGDSSSLTPVAPLVGNDSVSTMLTTTTDVTNKALFALNTRLLATVTVSPSNVRAANNDAVDGDIIMITPGEVDLSSGQLSVGKALTFECTDPTTKCIFDAKARSSSTRRVIYDTHGKTATSRYVGLEITGGYTVRLKRNNRKRRSQHRSVVGSRSKKTTN